MLRKSVIVGVKAIALIVGFLVIWQLASTLFGATSKSGINTVPGPKEAIDAFPQLSTYFSGAFGVEAPSLTTPDSVEYGLLALAQNGLATIFRLAVGVAIGLFLGVGLGIVVTWMRPVREAVAPLAHFARMLPLLAMLPLFGLWFGATSLSAIVFVAFSVFTVLFVVTINAIENVPGYYSNYARSLGSSAGRLRLSVILPAALPEIRGGLLLAMGFAWSAVIAGEFLGQETGLGRIIQRAGYFSQTDLLALMGVLTVIAAGLTFILITLLLNWATRWVEA
ncbi:MAG TPA: ABC transporter permease subunit [Solirubrobacterales bacterium]|nr:ABC transporter permease subunit [Solirubrobacterales bacterium]